MPSELSGPELLRDLQMLGQGLIALLLGMSAASAQSLKDAVEAAWQRSPQGKLNRASLVAAACASTRAHPRY